MIADLVVSVQRDEAAIHYTLYMYRPRLPQLVEVAAARNNPEAEDKTSCRVTVSV